MGWDICIQYRNMLHKKWAQTLVVSLVCRHRLMIMSARMDAYHYPLFKSRMKTGL